ncbi:ankyrin repeat domain-containing protein [Gordonia sp. ABSL11-1]|uniref:ankyrin repeat domain-containing protein n=1 Tax=Gordonia sp. ABSL11-1 TaxID=3053924 RepID=UPI0025741B27|nr:ankyrin repeat domain-containing protein [Gordonia sp. ABSL11-1]MDL9948663.1 ankyrin repeat domain-containing protein [Gordonia sp. ABSL11-1]
MGRDQLHYAALDGDVVRVAELLDAGTDPDVRDIAGWAPLHFAAQDNRLDAAQTMLRAGADVNARNEHGNVPLWIAVMKGARRGDDHLPMIELLKTSGTDLHARNNSGTSILRMLGNVAWCNGSIMSLFAADLSAQQGN